MKTYNIKIDVFKFDELSEDAREQAITNYIELLLQTIPYEEGSDNFKKAITKVQNMKAPRNASAYIYEYCKDEIFEHLSFKEFEESGDEFIPYNHSIVQDIKNEFKVFIISCGTDFDFRGLEGVGDYGAIMTKANKNDMVYDLQCFQDEINDGKLCLDNSYILIRKVKN